jgi:hypothetical protein
LAHSLVPTKRGTILVAAICDGAGSAPHSDIGASVASATFVNLVEGYFLKGGTLRRVDQSLAVKWVGETSAAVRQAAHERNRSARDFASTFLAAIIGPHAAVFIQIGDGAIVVSDGLEDDWSWVFWPSHGEYVNQTVFLVSPDAVEKMGFEFADRRIDAVALFTDGIERLVLNTRSRTVNHAFFDQMLAPVVASQQRGIDRSLSSALATYLSSPVVNDRTSDDKTLVMATRRPRVAEVS